MAMQFKRKWDFDQGNKPVLLNDLTQDREVIEVLRDAIAIAARGEDGRGIESFTRTSGDGSPGTADTYTISYTDSTSSTLTVYHGRDGDGAMVAAEVPFDPALAGMTATDVQAALEELHGDIAAVEAEPFDEEAVRDTIGAALVAGENITVTVDDVANTITIASTASGGGNSLFRGVWSPDELIDTMYFEDGQMPPEVALTKGTHSSTALPYMSTVGAAGHSGAPAGVSNAIVVPLNNVESVSENYSQAELDMAAFPGVTRIFVWAAVRDDGANENYSRPALRVDGTNQHLLSSPRAWARYELSIESQTSKVQFRHYGGISAFSGTNQKLFIAKLDIYGTAEPYQANEFVIHNSKLWKCITPGNSSEPGTNGDWAEALNFPEVLADLTDVSPSFPTPGQVLTFDGTSWAPADSAGGGGGGGGGGGYAPSIASYAGGSGTATGVATAAKGGVWRIDEDLWITHTAFSGGVVTAGVYGVAIFSKAAGDAIDQVLFKKSDLTFATAGLKVRWVELPEPLFIPAGTSIGLISYRANGTPTTTFGDYTTDAPVVLEGISATRISDVRLSSIDPTAGQTYAVATTEYGAGIISLTPAAMEAGGGGGGSVATLSDVDLTDIADGQVLVYDAATSSWKAEPVQIDYTGVWERLDTSFTYPTASSTTISSGGAVGTAKPATPQVSYTLAADDVLITPSNDQVSYVPGTTLVVAGASGATGLGTLYMEATVNGVAYAANDTGHNASEQFVARITIPDAQVGDVVEVFLWGSSGGGTASFYTVESGLASALVGRPTDPPGRYMHYNTYIPGYVAGPTPPVGYGGAAFTQYSETMTIYSVGSAVNPMTATGETDDIFRIPLSSLNDGLLISGGMVISGSAVVGQPGLIPNDTSGLFGAARPARIKTDRLSIADLPAV